MGHHMSKKWVVLLCASALHLMPPAIAAERGESRDERKAEVERLQQVTDALRVRLSILERVLVTVVDHNPLVMSVETLSGRSGPFVITADAAFVESLSDEELKAAVAHGLGHVWIYTHHPYLQTERLANDIAMRVITPDVLVPVYEKVWKRTGARGNLAEYISFDPSRAVAEFIASPPSRTLRRGLPSLPVWVNPGTHAPFSSSTSPATSRAAALRLSWS